MPNGEPYFEMSAVEELGVLNYSWELVNEGGRPMAVSDPREYLSEEACRERIAWVAREAGPAAARGIVDFMRQIDDDDQRPES